MMSFDNLAMLPSYRFAFTWGRESLQTGFISEQRQACYLHFAGDCRLVERFELGVLDGFCEQGLLPN